MYLRRNHKPRGSNRQWLRLVLGIALGAFAAHGLTAVATAGTESESESKTESWTRVEVRVMYDEEHGEECRRCHVQTMFIKTLREMGVTAEAARLSNGVMVFYTTGHYKLVPALQEIVEVAVVELEEINDDPEEGHLCEFCFADFPIYSKLDHELLETKRGVILLLTSEDKRSIAAVQKMFRVYDKDRYREQRYREDGAAPRDQARSQN